MSKPANPKIVAIVQARLGSARLPLKSLLTFRGLPIINWVCQRLGQSKGLNEIIVAIPDTDLDRVLLDHLKQGSIACMTGPENDVLKRFTLAADSAQADLVVRVCADNPLIWGEAVDQLIDFYLNTDCDYAWNHIPRDNMWPDGLGAEIISAKLLRELDQKASLPGQREHCFNYIWDNREQFRMATFNPKDDYLCRPDIKLDIDSAEDFRRLALLPLSPNMDAKEIVAAWDNLGGKL